MSAPKIIETYRRGPIGDVRGASMWVEGDRQRSAVYHIAQIRDGMMWRLSGPNVADADELHMMLTDAMQCARRLLTEGALV